MKYTIILFTIFIFKISSCTGQRVQHDPIDKQTLANDFVHLLKEIVDSNRINSFIPELVVSKDELRFFLDEEFIRLYGKRRYAKIQQEFGHPFDPAWKEIRREEGFYLTQPFIRNKNMITDEKEFKSTFVNAKFSDINVTSVEQYDSAFGEISKLKIFVITANMITDSNPIYEYKVSFPCILTQQNNFKLIAKMKGEYISTELNSNR